MTEKLFYQDSHMTEFSACVQACVPKGNHFEVVLDRTAFFPEGGGQYADTGRLDDIRVVDAHERCGVIYHETEAPLAVGSEVHGKIDWDMRFLKMQQHTGEHIVSGLVHGQFGYNNVGFHLGSEDCTMDFDGELTKEELRQIERWANEAVAENLEVQVTYLAPEEKDSMEYRSKIEISDTIRIVTIPGYDVCACCAPHVKRTGEIGLIKLTNVQRYKGGVRVTMLCGFRALGDYCMKEEQVKRICALLCAKEAETADAVEHLKEEKNALKAALDRAQRTILEYRVKEIPEEEIFPCLFVEELTGDGPRFLMNLVLEQGRKGCAVFLKTGEEEYRFVIGSRQMDVRPLAGEIRERFGGRGGGKAEMIQGSLKGMEEELRAWVQTKARKTEDE